MDDHKEDDYDVMHHVVVVVRSKIRSKPITSRRDGILQSSLLMFVLWLQCGMGYDGYNILNSMPVHLVAINNLYSQTSPVWLLTFLSRATQLSAGQKVELVVVSVDLL